MAARSKRRCGPAKDESFIFSKNGLFSQSLHNQIAPLGGQEQTCAVTAQYNRRMQAILPAYGVHVTEIPRLNAISATTVRARLLEGDVAAVRALVPKTTYEACRSLFGAGAPCP